MGYEADDLLGTISSRLSKRVINRGCSRAIGTLQLVNENVSLLFTKKGINEIIQYTPDK